MTKFSLHGILVAAGTILLTGPALSDHKDTQAVTATRFVKPQQPVRNAKPVHIHGKYRGSVVNNASPGRSHSKTCANCASGKFFYSHALTFY